MPAAYAAADVVAVPYVSPPVHGQVVAEAQAMARPVVTTAVGALPEHLLAPPRMADELRTGWVVPPKNPGELALALAEALALDDEAFDALAARAREFAEFVFAPDRVAGATLEVYSALLEANAEPAIRLFSLFESDRAAARQAVRALPCATVQPKSRRNGRFPGVKALTC